jgi:hypothetical protein
VSSRILTAVLVVGLAGAVALLGVRAQALRIPGNQQGYEPVQPIAYSHRLHAGEMQIACLYCHYGAERSRHAGIPAASVCMNCHRFVGARLGAIRAEEARAREEGRRPEPVVSGEIRKLYRALGRDASLRPDPEGRPRPIAWTRVHALPDFVHFDHRPHVAAGVTCQQCHGPVETMERVRQEAPLTMGWCVNCHRQVNREGVDGRSVKASIDCATCHV